MTNKTTTINYFIYKIIIQINITVENPNPPQNLDRLKIVVMIFNRYWIRNEVEGIVTGFKCSVVSPNEIYIRHTKSKSDMLKSETSEYVFMFNYVEARTIKKKEFFPETYLTSKRREKSNTRWKEESPQNCLYTTATY